MPAWRGSSRPSAPALRFQPRKFFVSSYCYDERSRRKVSARRHLPVAAAPERSVTIESMPLYEYRCHSCGKTLEVMQKFADDPRTVHEDCGGELEIRGKSKKRTALPSGDQRGNTACMGGKVNCTRSLPSALLFQRVPSG